MITVNQARKNTKSSSNKRAKTALKLKMINDGIKRSSSRGLSRVQYVLFTSTIDHDRIILALKRSGFHLEVAFCRKNDNGSHAVGLNISWKGEFYERPSCYNTNTQQSNL